MTEEDSSNGGRCESPNDGIEESARIRQSIIPIVSTGNMCYNPTTLSLRFAGFELRDQERKYARLVRIREIEVVEDIIDVPEVRVHGNNAKALSGCVCIGSII